MIKLIDKLSTKWMNAEYPFLIHKDGELRFTDIADCSSVDLVEVRAGDVVGLIGDFNPTTIHTFLKLIDFDCIIVPLSTETRNEHEYFFDTALVDVVIDSGKVSRRFHTKSNPLIKKLRDLKHGGLVFFSTGTTGRPKAILHDLTIFLKRFDTPRPTLRTMNFLLFDHIGGINTLMHTLFNKGVIIAPNSRTVDDVLETCRRHDVEVLPATPTFLRMMLMSGAVPEKVPDCIKIISYGTERMDQPTLDALCELLPSIDFRQTYGMSELGIVRVKSEARDSLFMRLGGEGVEYRVVDGILQIRSESRMVGYLNEASPFDADGWYDTKDVVEFRNGYVRVVGRIGEVINVAGLKFMASEVERVALTFPEVSLVKAIGRPNPISGQHVEIFVESQKDIDLDKKALTDFLKQRLQSHMVPKRIHLGKIDVGHRHKKA